MAFLKSCIVPLLMIVLIPPGCHTQQDTDCGYNTETIMVLANRKALVRIGEHQSFLFFGDGLVTESSSLMDTIYSLLPCNLPAEYHVDSLAVIVSGEIKENPAYSSHTNYTDFFITRISAGCGCSGR